MQGEGEEWRVVTGEFSSPMHIALDRVITRKVAEGESPPTLRFWDWQDPTVVIGRFQSLKEEVFEDMADRYGIEVVRRTTGGGAMFCEPRDVITYSLSLSESWLESDDIVDSYREMEDWSLDALDNIGVEAEHQPINDIVHGEKKIGGSAQGRRGGTVLHHTMLAYDLEVEKMLKVLRIGEEKISDKAIQSAEKRVSLLSDQVDLPRGEIIERMVESFAQGRSVRSGRLKEEEIEEAEKLVEQRYGTEEWTYKVDREIEGLE